jgi:SAM-dependent methyltransferase
MTKRAMQDDGNTSTSSIFATPRIVRDVAECGQFYHTMEIPGQGLVRGYWDLRGGTDEYLGNFDFTGKRVLEIGPASGFLTFELEKRGADVVAADVADQRAWDFVPYPRATMQSACETRNEQIRLLKNSFWFAHRKFGSQAKAWYGDIYNLPEGLGEFDVAVMASVLLHLKSPLLVMAECAKRASTLIVTDLLYPELEGQPVCRLDPTPENRHWDTWWNLSSDIIRQFASVLGFSSMTTSYHQQYFEDSGANAHFFTVIARR